MELTVDEKIQAAIEPLISRIVALQTNNQKFKTELAALQASTQSKIPQKQLKVVQEVIDRPQTVKAGRKKQEDKANLKKEEGKDDHEQIKVDNTKAVNGKIPTVGHKPVPQVIHKETTPHVDPKNPKDPKNKLPGVVGQGVNTKETLGNKSGVHQKKPIGVKTSQNQHEKKEEGSQKIEQKKGHPSQQKPDQKDPKAGKPSLPTNTKNPVPNKIKPADKVVPEKKPVGTSNTNKKGGKVVMGGAPKDVKVEETKATENIQKEEPLLIAPEDNKEEVKSEEVKHIQEVPEVKKEEQVPPPSFQEAPIAPKVQTEVEVHQP